MDVPYWVNFWKFSKWGGHFSKILVLKTNYKKNLLNIGVGLDVGGRSRVFWKFLQISSDLVVWYIQSSLIGDREQGVYSTGRSNLLVILSTCSQSPSAGVLHQR